jgi:single-stranded DNA-binding protein
MAFADACHKGDLIKVSGRCKAETWTTDAGEKRTQWVITADEWEMVRPFSGGDTSAAPTRQAPFRAPAPAPAQTSWANQDDGIPF